MADKKQDFIDQKLHDLNNDGVDRRGFLKCMAWAGTGTFKICGNLSILAERQKRTKHTASYSPSSPRLRPVPALF